MVLLLQLLALPVAWADLVALFGDVMLCVSSGRVWIRTRKLSVGQCGQRRPACEAVSGSDRSLARLLLVLIRRRLTCGDTRA